MTNDKELFKDLKLTNITLVRVRNGNYISFKSKGTIGIANCSGTKFILTSFLYPKFKKNY